MMVMWESDNAKSQQSDHPTRFSVHPTIIVLLPGSESLVDTLGVDAYLDCEVWRLVDLLDVL